MKIRFAALLVAAVAAVAMLPQSADAGSRYKHKKVSKAVVHTAIGAGAVSAVAYWSAIDWSWHRHSTSYKWGAWGATTIVCVAASPIVATALKKAPLTQREAHVLMGSCVVPVVGGWLVNAAYKSHPHWDPDHGKYRRGKYRKHKKKM